MLLKSADTKRMFYLDLRGRHRISYILVFFSKVNNFVTQIDMTVLSDIWWIHISNHEKIIMIPLTLLQWKYCWCSDVNINYLMSRKDISWYFAKNVRKHILENPDFELTFTICLIPGLSPRAHVTCGWLVSGPGPESPGSRSSRCCRD